MSSWNGNQIGFRVFHESLLKLNSINGSNLTEVQLTHNNTDYLFPPFTEAAVTLTINDLDVFTNYSLVVGAMTGAGVGAIDQIFCRTAEGGMCFSMPLFVTSRSTQFDFYWGHFSAEVSRDVLVVRSLNTCSQY